MADDKKITGLAAATLPLAGTEKMEIVQGGVNKQVDVSEVGGGGAVDSVNGATGVVVLDAGDIDFTPAGDISATDVQAALEELNDYVNSESLGFNPVDELTEIAGISLESDITTAQLLQALAIPASYGIHVSASVPLTMTNMPLAETVLAGSSAHYVRVDATNYRQARLECSIITMSGSTNSPRMYLKYSINGGGAWVTLGAGTTASGDAINFFTGSAAVQVTNWIDLPAEAKGDFLWRVVTVGGDDVIDLPVIGNIHLQFRT